MTPLIYKHMYHVYADQDKHVVMQLWCLPLTMMLDIILVLFPKYHDMCMQLSSMSMQTKTFPLSKPPTLQTGVD